MRQPSRTEPLATAADRAACRALIRTGSRSFHAASLLLPHAVRDGAYALYAFCRLSDDAVDNGPRNAHAISRLSARLDAVYAGRHASSVDAALADTVREFDIPRAILDALLDGLQWDVEARQYETEADLSAYAARVAGSVGAMMAALMGARSRPLLARACDLGVAMQYTNIARDVGEDARNGRLYMPRAWMREAGLDPDAWLAAPTYSPALASVVARLLARADDLYRRADEGIALLPGAFRPAIRGARLLYSEIGAEVARGRFDSVSARARVVAARKVVLMLRALAPSRPGDASMAPALPETQFLVDAAARGSLGDIAAAPTLEGDLIWVLELFERLERRNLARAA